MLYVIMRMSICAWYLRWQISLGSCPLVLWVEEECSHFQRQLLQWQPVPVPSAVGRAHRSPEYRSPALGHAKGTAKWLVNKLGTISVVFLKHLWVQEEGTMIGNKEKTLKDPLSCF